MNYLAAYFLTIYFGALVFFYREKLPVVVKRAMNSFESMRTYTKEDWITVLKVLHYDSAAEAVKNQEVPVYKPAGRFNNGVYFFVVSLVIAVFILVFPVLTISITPPVLEQSYNLTLVFQSGIAACVLLAGSIAFLGFPRRNWRMTVIEQRGAWDDVWQNLRFQGDKK